MPRILLIACLAFANWPIASLVKASESRPNIVIIFTDDQGYGDLGCYGLKTAKTPNLDQLAKEGTRFTSFYTQPVCGPARSALLTGRYPARSKGWSMPASEITFAELMQDAGYATCCIGKWDVSNRKPIIDRMPLAKGFDYYWGPLGANDSGGVRLWENNEFVGDSRDLSSLSRTYTDRSIDWIEQHLAKSKDQPFLLYLCHTMMHTVIDASPEFKNRTGNGLYADTLEELDHECGRLLDAIDELGLRGDTLVIFTSDNGPWSNDQKRQHAKNDRNVEWSKGPEIAWGDAGPLRGGKASSYEGGVRVPCLVRWPNKVPAGRVSDAIFATIDFMPTFANLTGYDVPQDRVIDGVDQTELLLGESETGNRDTYFYHSGSHGVRQGKWKLLKAGRWPKNFNRTYPKDLGTNGTELYDLEQDIGETQNQADTHPEIVERLTALKLSDEKSQSSADARKTTDTKTSDTRKFTPLFDGKTFKGWQHNGNWVVEDGAFFRKAKGGSLTYTAATVPDDFELRFEWKVSKGCNSGVYYRPTQVEYQVLDNVHSPYGENPRQAAASLFFCMAPSKDATRPHGEWNTARIVCKGSVIQHWLNGEAVVDFDYNDPKWAEMVKLLKIRGGDLTKRGGQLWLQDHGQDVWFRNLRWREIPTAEKITPDPAFQPMPIPEAALAKERARVERMLEKDKPKN